MRTKTLITFLLLCNFALGADPAARKADLASQFYDATTAKLIETMASDAAKAILREDSSKVRQSEIYRQWALESFGSAEYKSIYVTYMIETFTEDDLVQMNVWAKSSTFQKYFVAWPKFQAWSMSRFQAFLRSKNPELMKRLQAEGLK